MLGAHNLNVKFTNRKTMGWYVGSALGRTTDPVLAILTTFEKYLIAANDSVLGDPALWFPSAVLCTVVWSYDM